MSPLLCQLSYLAVLGMLRVPDGGLDAEVHLKPRIRGYSKHGWQGRT